MGKRMILTVHGLAGLALLAMAIGGRAESHADSSQAPDTCQARGRIYADCGQNVRGIVRGWIELKRDPQTHLYSRGRTWDYHNEAADQYSSLVLMAHHVAPEHNRPGGTFHETMVNSRALCASPSGIPTVYNLKTRQPGKTAAFGHLSEWLRDGLIRIVEVKGTDNIWYEEMVRLTDAMLTEAENRGGVFTAFEGHEPWGNMLWPRTNSSDDWSDSYESIIVLWNRYPQVGDGFEWLDWATLQHIHRRKTESEYGPYTGGHFDGSTGRTLCIHMMMCSQGVRHQPPQPGVGIGGVQQEGELFLTVQSDSAYRGALCFDGPRTEYGERKIDWARINEMPQWYVVRPEGQYSVTIGDQPFRTLSGQELIDGMPIDVVAGAPLAVRVKQVRE